MKRQPIQIDNYEEYFLLYVDNELTPAEREEVEAFIAQHPELNTELQMLLDTRLDLEVLPMAGREKLYRQEEPGLINHDNVEEFQVLMLDDELGKDDRAALEKYHAIHEEARKNFDWLRKAKLPTEQVEFPNKKLLYRTEKKPASIINIKWYRVAAAAAVIITAGLLWISSQREESLTGNIDQIAQVDAAGNDLNSGGNTTDAKADQVTKGLPETTSPSIATVEKPVDQRPENRDETGTDLTSSRAHEKSGEIKTGRARTIDAGKGPIKNTEKPVKETFETKPNRTTEEYAKSDPVKTVDIVDKVAEEYITAPNDMATTAALRNIKTNYAADALNNEMAEDDEDVLEQDAKQRKGLRGIVRKANRFYNKVTNPDIDKPMVKVANFEIGLSR
jgi:hypothetical protein